MQLVIFVLAYPLIWFLSKLPMRILYFFSDLFYALIFYIIGYRKKVVFNNLKLAFPNKSESERTKIAKGFFKHMGDLLFESIKSFSITEKEITKRYVFKNPELINEIAAQGKSIALVGSHQANWEWSNSLALHVNITCYAAYTKIANNYFEKVIKTSREKFGFIGYKTSDTIRGMKKNTTKGKQGLYILLSDQSPQVSKTYYWSEFMGIKVPIHTGAEMLSKRFELTVVNYATKKVKRGYYETEFTLVTDSPKDFENYQITDKYLAITEAGINENPEHYLWSHRRFKHRHKVPKEFQD